MSQTAVVPTLTITSKKGIRKAIQEKLSITLADYRSVVGDKKFDSRIRKAARMLSESVNKALPKKQKVKKLKVVQEEEKGS